MVIDFFRTAPDGLATVDSEVLVMLGNCRHSFDLAVGALFSDGDVSSVADEVRGTDEKINAAEENVRRELIVHTAVQGGSDVGTVLGLLLVVKKLERVGDQAKNILNLAEEGVRFSGDDDADAVVAMRNRISTMFADAQSVLTADEPDAEALITEGHAIMEICEDQVRAQLHSEQPGSYAVPRAMLYRYFKRTAANVLGTVATVVEGVDRFGDEDLDE